MASDQTDQFFIEAATRVQNLFTRLQACPEVELLGVIHPSGAGGSSGQYSIGWELGVDVQPWRLSDGGLSRRVLRIRRPGMDRDEINAFCNALKPYDVVRFRVQLSEENPGDEDSWNNPQALLLEVLETGVDDPEMRSLAEALQKPKVFHDKNLGDLHLDRRVNWVEGRRKAGFLGLRGYKITIDLREDETYDGAMVWKKVLFVEKNLSLLHENILENLFEIYNSNWKSLGPLNEKQFLRKLRLDSIGISTDGDITVYFQDGGTFQSHLITIFINEDGKISSANLAG
jgi:hypothetical protein